MAKIRKKIRKLQLMCALLALCMLLVSCTAGETGEESAAQESTLQGEMGEENAAQESTLQGETEWDNVQPELCVVTVQAGNLTGSGVIHGLTKDQEQCIVFTAGHVLDELAAEELPTVLFEDGTEYTCSGFLRGDTIDAALLFFSDGDMLQRLEEGDCFAREDMQHFSDLRDGDECIAIGSGTGETRQVSTGTILDNWIYMEDYGQYMVWADVLIHSGMSGGGLFDSEGYLVGILSGGSEDGQAAAVPFSLILSEFHNSLD